MLYSCHRNRHEIHTGNRFHIVQCQLSVLIIKSFEVYRPILPDTHMGPCDLSF